MGTVHRTTALTNFYGLRGRAALLYPLNAPEAERIRLMIDRLSALDVRKPRQARDAVHFSKAADGGPMLDRLFGWFRGSDGPRIDLTTKCPACGHRGCELSFVKPPVFETGKGRSVVKIEEARVRRTCKTCGAEAYEATVLPPEHWLAK